VVRWHEDQALASLEAANWDAALWHVDRLLGSQPDNWLAHVLRTEANVQLGNTEAAAADFARAIALGPPEPVVDWFRAYAAGHAEQDRSREVLWYLDRLVAARPEVAVLHLQRARACVTAKHWREADADYTRALELSREDAQLWVEKANFDTRLGEWKNAARAFDRALAIEPDDHAAWYESAAVHFLSGDMDGYRRHCREMLTRFGETTDPTIAERVAKTCLLLPDAVPDRRLVENLIMRAVTGTEKHTYYPFFILAKGIAEYRAGRAQQAIEPLEKSLTYSIMSQPRFTSLVRLVLAMAYEQTGRRGEAREALKQARALVDSERENWKQEGSYKDLDWARCMVVLREAEGLIEGKTRSLSAENPSSDPR
jgi:serine/threonine-protein kinase